MHFLTPTECSQWCEGMESPLDESRRPTRELNCTHRLCCRFPPSFTQLQWFSRCIESAMLPRRECLLWVTDWGISHSMENLHAYYRFRQSYGDLRLLHEAPGHLCLDYERPEVVTLIHYCVLFAWDVHLIPSVGFGRAFVCHDEWVELGFTDRRLFEETKRQLETAKLKVSVL